MTAATPVAPVTGATSAEVMPTASQPSSGSIHLVASFVRCLDIDSKAWPGLEETAAYSDANHHVGAYLRIMVEEDNVGSSEKDELQLALAKSIDAMAMSLETVQPAEEKKAIRHDWSFEPSEPASFKLSAIREEAIRRYNHACDRGSMLANISINYPMKVTILFELLSACVADSPQDCEKVSVRRKGYDARHRIALRLLATWLDINWTKMEAMEIIVAVSAMAANKEQQQSEENDSAKSKWAKWKRGGIIGAAALTGGALLAITGGLAAPAIAAGFGALAPTLGTLVPVIGASGFAAVASAAGSVAGSVAVAASFGAAGAGLSGSKMARRIGDVEEFEFKTVGGNHNQGRLAVGILVSGFVFKDSDFVSPWEAFEDNLERYALQWESKNLIAVSTAIQDWLTSTLTRELMKRGAMLTVLNSLVIALAWPAALLSATDFIDSKWTIAIDRSDKAGKLLAETLMKGLQGNRPVTLIGFSLGARVIFKCLQQLAESGENEGLIERVVLLGAPIKLNDEEWAAARKMVAGRFINVYSTNDWILGVTFRASLITQGLAGIQAVVVPGIENVDVTEIIDGHSSYLSAVPKILEQLELDTCYGVFSYPPQLSD
ncbi:transmembrane and coiled-coil domain-containing protein 4-like isoform X2 [Phalaenopsis equestris]|uniref:transmembrane and coiled-coil domain-containing protein 4-like isoform X2 n=1 Tax=Phalaenopsis equestris TaxID=78828 RepID=UPI0009E5BA56|nr:transmembrane and coiled-coil domain-containing protein 4-like isoform X2 [Phalaenopsis equestris]